MSIITDFIENSRSLQVETPATDVELAGEVATLEAVDAIQLDTSSVAQTKTGDLTIGGALKSDTSLAVGSAILAPTGLAPMYACRAWVNFNGTGTVAIRASGNVSSIVDNGVGDYTVNFITAMEDENYGTDLTVGRDANALNNAARIIQQWSSSTTIVGSVRVVVQAVDHANTPAANDQEQINVSINR